MMVMIFIDFSIIIVGFFDKLCKLFDILPMTKNNNIAFSTQEMSTDVDNLIVDTTGTEYSH